MSDKKDASVEDELIIIRCVKPKSSIQLYIDIYDLSIYIYI